MKKVYVTQQGGVYWACNGQRMAGLTLTSSFLEGRENWLEAVLRRDGKRDVQVRIVEVPKNRCKTCGGKQ